MEQRVGSPAFVAPEVILGSYTEGCDLWSLGVFMYFLLCGYLPFSGDTDTAMLKLILSAHVKFNPDNFRQVPGSCKEFIRQLLQRSVKRRLTAPKALQHDWLAACLGDRSARMPAALLVDRQSLASRLGLFAGMGIMKQFILFVMATHAETAEIHDLMEAFSFLDRESSGILSMASVETMLDVPMLRLARPGSGQDTGDLMDYKHFLAAALAPEFYLQESLLAETFHSFDSRRCGFISTLDVSSVAKSVRVLESTLAASSSMSLTLVEEEMDGKPINYVRFKEIMEAPPNLCC